LVAREYDLDVVFGPVVPITDVRSNVLLKELAMCIRDHKYHQALGAVGSPQTMAEYIADFVEVGTEVSA
jgi:hypothetical protein